MRASALISLLGLGCADQPLSTVNLATVHPAPVVQRRDAPSVHHDEEQVGASVSTESEPGPACSGLAKASTVRSVLHRDANGSWDADVTVTLPNVGGMFDPTQPIGAVAGQVMSSNEIGTTATARVSFGVFRQTLSYFGVQFPVRCPSGTGMLVVSSQLPDAPLDGAPLAASVDDY